MPFTFSKRAMKWNLKNQKALKREGNYQINQSKKDHIKNPNQPHPPDHPPQHTKENKAAKLTKYKKNHKNQKLNKNQKLK